MYFALGLDMISVLFTGSVDSQSVAGPSVFLGEMSITGIIPPGDTITVGGRPYAF